MYSIVLTRYDPAMRKLLVDVILLGIAIALTADVIKDAIPYLPAIWFGLTVYYVWDLATSRPALVFLVSVKRKLPRKVAMFSYLIVALCAAGLADLYWYGLNRFFAPRIAAWEAERASTEPATRSSPGPTPYQQTRPPQPIPRPQSALGETQPREDARGHAESGPGPRAAPHEATRSQMGGPIENLARLGWNIKGDEKGGTTFEIVGKPLPNLKESADYFRALRKPFQIHLQQVNSLEGFNLLSGIDNFVGLDIGASDMDDLSELRGLTGLRSLNISQTPFTTRNELDITPIASLVNLQTLGLGMSRVTSLEPIHGLTRLTSLGVGGSLVRDLSPIRNLRMLKSLDVRDSNVKDLSPLDQDQALEELTLDAKQVPSLTALSNLPKLSKLTLIAQIPVDTVAIGSLPNLRSLSIWGPPVVNLSSLRKLGHLENLNVSGFGFLAGRSQVIDADAIGDLTQLKTLALGQLQIDSLRFLVGNQNLIELNLSGLPVASMPELANLASLKRLNLVDVPVVDISPLLSLSNLEQLSLLRTPARADVVSELQRRGVKVIIN
jgi:Leucine-rich repeat (LRR) protein